MRPAAKLDHDAEIAKTLLRREIGPHVADVTVRQDDDYAGESSLFFEALLDETAPVDFADHFTVGHLALRHALQAEGEIRFPYLQTRRPPGFTMPEDIFLKFRHAIAARRSGGAR